MKCTGKSDDLVGLRETLVSLGRAGVVLADAPQMRLAIDTNILLQELLFHVRRKRNPAARTMLQEAVASETVVLFVPESVIEEVDRGIPRIALQWAVPESSLREVWVEYRRLVNVCPNCHLRPRQNCHMSTLALRDSDDLPILAVADTVGAVAVLSRDKDFGGRETGDLTLRVLVSVRDHARHKVFFLQVEVAGIGITGAPIMATAGLAKLIARSPLWVKILLGCGIGASILAVALRPSTRARVSKGLRSALDTAGAFFDERVAPILERAEEALRRSESAWAEIERCLPASFRPTLRQVAFAICLASDNPLSIEEIQRRVLVHGYKPKGRSHGRYLARVLREDGRLRQLHDGRWCVHVEPVHRTVVDASPTKRICEVALHE